MREKILEKLMHLLSRNGFSVSSFFHTNSCFDLIAKKEDLKIAIKILANIDALRKEQADELKKVSKLFGVSAIVIGDRTKVFNLRKGVVYERYGIPVLNLEAFSDMLHNKLPFIKYFKGRQIVEIDSGKLRLCRTEKRLSLQDAAEQLNLTKESLHRFEQETKTSFENAKRLEKFFDCTLIKRPEMLFRPEIKREFIDDEIHDTTLNKISDLGMRLAVFRHAPFYAVGDTKEDLLIGIGKEKKDIIRKAAELKKSKSALDSDSVIVAKDEFRPKAVDDIAIVKEHELDSLSGKKDLLKLIRERENET